MIVKGENKKKAVAYIKDRYPIGSIIVDSHRSGTLKIKKNSIFEVHSDCDQVANFKPEYEYYCFNVRNPGCDVDYHIRHTPKRWIMEYYEKKLLKTK
jgi:hypothetical protein